MRVLFKISFVLSIAFLMGFVSPEKKLNKLVSKVWKGKEATLSPVDIPDSVMNQFGDLNEVYIDNALTGYACYTTAFGCRVGGCAAPGNPNAQSFETFDYIVVYDLNFEILKVDVANYGGQYGYEICRSKWLQQFEGSTDGFVLNENIDGITGATVSAQYLIDDLNEIGKKLKELDFLNTSN